MRRRVRTVTLSFAVLAAAACGRPSSDALPPPVATAVAALADECSRVDGIPHTDGAVKRADFTGDGREDFVLYTGWIDCENAASIYGDREKGVAVYAGDGAGAAAAAFDDSVYDVTIEDNAGARQLWLTVAAQRCGRPQAASFSEESFCDRAIVWDAAAGRFDYAPVSTVRMIE